MIPSDYSLFRENIKPKWEDVSNKSGGSWFIEFERNNTEVSLVQEVWNQLQEYAVNLSNNTKATCKHLCGVKISMRFKLYQISIWTKYFYE